MKNKNFEKILASIVVFLSLTFILSFVFEGKAETKKEKIKSALVTENLKYSIDYFEIQSGGELLSFWKKTQGFDDSVWFCGYWTEDGIVQVPCRREKILEFISELCSLRDFEKLSLKNANDKNFGLDDENAFVVYYNAGDQTRDFRFGDSDFSGTRIYVTGSRSETAGKNQDSSVYLSEKKPFEKFLYTGINQWYDPYLLSRELGVEYKESDVMSPSVSGLLELRHGGLSYYKPSEEEVPLHRIKVEMGDTAFYDLQVYPVPDEDSYHVQVTYTNPVRAFGTYSYGVKISNWTLNKLLGKESSY